MSEDAEATFWRVAVGRRREHRPLLDEGFGPMARFLPTILGRGAVMEAGGLFQLHPHQSEAAKNAWRWIIAVREAYGSAVQAALFGDIVDLVAVDASMTRPVSRLRGYAPVLGYPQDPTIAEAPVRVFASVMRWIQGGFAGIVLIGDRAEQQTYLRACATGIVADDLTHAEALQLKMRREVPALPKLFVAEAA